MTVLKSPLLEESYRTRLIPPSMSCDMCIKCCPPGRPFRDSVPRVFIGGLSHRHPLPSMYQNCRLSEGRQVLSINCVVCANSPGTVSRLLSRSGGRLSISKVSDTSLGHPCQEDFLLMAASRPAVFTPFCTEP